ncbi:MAG: DUF6618 family protein [Lachnospiraceae bacterium]|jgi:hypothetical protein|nr:DUF6618 family protein [Lachnospiraceae bacterium]
MTPFTFQYKDTEGKPCKGSVVKFVGGDPMEAELEANGWTFHVIVGTQWYGNYICIPNWSVGSELANLGDEFWNYERLCEYTQLKKDNAKAIARALAEIGERL